MKQSELLENLCRYLTALESGNMEQIAKILEIAQSEPILAINLDVIHQAAVNQLSPE
jgi:hypothetical protein